MIQESSDPLAYTRGYFADGMLLMGRCLVAPRASKGIVIGFIGGK
jgi:hypothetical protein